MFHRSLAVALLALHAAACVAGLSNSYGALRFGQLPMVAVLLALNAVAYRCVSKMVGAVEQT